jgi:hypothetical protein
MDFEIKKKNPTEETIEFAGGRLTSHQDTNHQVLISTWLCALVAWWLKIDKDWPSGQSRRADFQGDGV